MMVPGLPRAARRTGSNGGVTENRRFAAGRPRAPLLFGLARRALFQLDPETAHRVTVRALAGGAGPVAPRAPSPPLAQTVFGLSFAHPLGLAAGFDKDAEVPAQMQRMGLAFTEIGTVTPRPQPGNARPRVFRLPHARALINRLGFNNAGHDAARQRLERLRGDARKRDLRLGPIGVNIGANRDTADKVADYVAGVRAFAAVADYLMVNVSSPNTPGLRDLQSPDALDRLLRGVIDARAEAADAVGSETPVMLKIAPDMTRDDAVALATLAAHRGVDGLCISNTTVARPGMRREGSRPDPRWAEAGGLSGAPLFARSTQLLAQVRCALGDAVPLIGCGGVMRGRDALDKVLAGACLVQVYTGLVYRGPDLIAETLDAFEQAVAQAGVSNVGELVGRDAHAWAQQDAQD